MRQKIIRNSWMKLFDFNVIQLGQAFQIRKSEIRYILLNNTGTKQSFILHIASGVRKAKKNGMPVLGRF